MLAGCSRRKAEAPAPALELYAGGIAPQLRVRCGHRLDLRRRIFFLSARHGLVRADTRLCHYDQPLTPGRTAALRPLIGRTLRRHLAQLAVPARLLVVADPLYLVLVADLLAQEDRPIVRWIPDPRGWIEAAAVLDEWNWP